MLLRKHGITISCRMNCNKLLKIPIPICSDDAFISYSADVAAAVQHAAL